MNEFKECQLRYIAIAGMKCPCCNQFRGKSKKKLNRMARAKLKFRAQKTVNYETKVIDN